MTAFDIALSRHDHHSLELKSTIDLGTQSLEARTELYLFAPATLKMSVSSKDDLVADFDSRVRLALSETQKGTDYATTVLEEFKRALEQYDPSNPIPLQESTVKAGAVLGEAIKQTLSEHLDRLRNQSAFYEEEIVLGARQIRHWVREILTTSQNAIALKIPYAQLLHEYIHSLYLRYLGKLSAGLRDAAQSYPWHQLADELKIGMQDVDSSSHQGLREDALKREQHFLHLSQLKKFFQSTMFVDVNRTQLVRKIAEPAAATAAGIAALWASIFQQFQQPGVIRFGLSGITFLSLGVVVYVFKDRIKEKTRFFVTRRASRYLPDLEQALVVKGKPIGSIREWFFVATHQDVSKEIQRRRSSYFLSDAEQHIPEDVFKYTRLINLSAASDDRHQAIQESLRINMERYLKHMDDPFKSITLMNENGEPEQVKTPRVYYFYLLGTLQMGTESRPLEYRVVMDKRGIQRVDALRVVDEDFQTLPLFPHALTT